MKRGSTDAETCRLNGWVVGTRLVGEERGKSAAITITAIGRANVLAIRDGWSTESVWSLSHREWRLAPDSDPEYCPSSQRVDGKRHSWKFDGDDPYVTCCFCGEMRDARSAAILRPANGGCGQCKICYPEWFGMYLCAICGNKRCPHATDCRHECTGSNEPGQAGSIHFGRPASHPGVQTDKSLPELLGLTEEASREFFGKWPEPNRCEATLGTVRCGLDARHVHGGPKSHCANPLRGDGSTWTGPGFIQWRDEPP